MNAQQINQELLAKAKDLLSAPTQQEIEAVAAAEWNWGCDVDGRLAWNELKSPLDDGVKDEFRQQARAGITEFIRLRFAKIPSAPPTLPPSGDDFAAGHASEDDRGDEYATTQRPGRFEQE